VSKKAGPNAVPYKYAEDKLLADLRAYIDATYSGHYQTDEETDDLQCLDAWISIDGRDATKSMRNVALKYLWRYGKKDGNNKKDLLKVLHYVFFMLYNDFEHPRNKK
jgi:hypothetical protein